MALFPALMILGVMTLAAYLCSGYAGGAWLFAGLLLAALLIATTLPRVLALRPDVRRKRRPGAVCLPAAPEAQRGRQRAAQQWGYLAFGTGMGLLLKAGGILIGPAAMSPWFLLSASLSCIAAGLYLLRRSVP